MHQYIHPRQCDGKTDDTLAIPKDDCYVNDAEGNISISKSFLSFALNITDVSHIGIEVESSLTLLISNDRKHWPGQENFIQLTKCNNIEIFGGGLINGQEQIWWEYPNDFRAHTIDSHGCNGLVIKDITIINPPSHCLELHANNTELSNITSDNTDAVNVHGSPFWIHGCYFNNSNIFVLANYL